MSIRFLTYTVVVALVAPLAFAELAFSQEDPPSEKPEAELGDILDDPTEGEMPRVSGQEAATGVEVQINQIDVSKFPQVGIFATVLRDAAPVPGLVEQDKVGARVRRSVRRLWFDLASGWTPMLISSGNSGVVGSIDSASKTCQVFPGTYTLDVGDQLIGNIEVAPNEEVSVNVKSAGDVPATAESLK